MFDENLDKLLYSHLSNNAICKLMVSSCIMSLQVHVFSLCQFSKFHNIYICIAVEHFVMKLVVLLSLN